jgi:hypothetical protein
VKEYGKAEPLLCHAAKTGKNHGLQEKTHTVFEIFVYHLFCFWTCTGFNSFQQRSLQNLSENLFPYLRKSDFTMLYLGVILGAFLFILSGKYNRLKTKYELLRHDIIRDLDSTIIATKICLCQGDCDCREQFVREMDELDIDIIFKKYKPESKYLI